MPPRHGRSQRTKPPSVGSQSPPFNTECKATANINIIIVYHNTNFPTYHPPITNIFRCTNLQGCANSKGDRLELIVGLKRMVRSFFTSSGLLRQLHFFTREHQHRAALIICKGVLFRPLLPRGSPYIQTRFFTLLARRTHMPHGREEYSST